MRTKPSLSSSMMRRAAGLVLLLSVLGLVTFAIFRAEGASGPNSETGAVVLPPGSSLRNGDAAPISLAVPDISGGRPIDIARLADGRPIVVNFFASWCPACAADLGSYAKLWQRDRHKVLFVGIDTNDPDRAAALALLRHAGAHYSTGVDLGSARITTAWGLSNGLPVTFFIRSDRRIALEVLGEESFASLARRVSDLEGGRALR